MDDFYSVPYPDFFTHRQDMHWPAYKFEMSMDELFTTLPKRFNTMTYPLLDSDAFFQDVSSASHAAPTKEEFFKLLQERRDLREKELKELLLRSFSQIAGRPGLIGDDDNVWLNAMFIHRYESFDAVVRFFAYFVPPNEAKTLPATALPPSPQPSSNSANVDTPLCPSSSTEDNPDDMQSKPKTPVNTGRELGSLTVKQPSGTGNHGNRVQKSNKDRPRRSLRLRMLSQCSRSSAGGAPAAKAAGTSTHRHTTVMARSSGRRTGKK